MENKFDDLIVFSSGFANHGFIVKDEGINGELFAFGGNSTGQLGVGDKSNKLQLTPNNFFGKKKIIKIICGRYHSIFHVEKTQILSTGSNQNCQLGKPSLSVKENKCIPTKCSFSLSVLEVTGGCDHTVILDKNFQVYSFGYNKYGQLGNGKTVNQGSLSKVIISEKILSISCGGFFCFFISIRGNIYVCGQNTHSQLGNNKNNNVKIPEKLLFFNNKKTRIICISCGWCFAMFLTSDNQTYGSGCNSSGELGTSRVNKFVPHLVESLKEEKIIKVKCGESHTFFRTNQKMWFCGYNTSNQCSVSDQDVIYKPILFSIKGKKVVQSLLMNHSSIHFTNENEVFGSGSNTYGELSGSKKSYSCTLSKLYNFRVKKYPKCTQLKLNEVKERFEFLLVENKDLKSNTTCNLDMIYL